MIYVISGKKEIGGTYENLYIGTDKNYLNYYSNYNAYFIIKVEYWENGIHKDTTFL